MNAEGEQGRGHLMYEITYQVGWWNKNGTTNETEVTVRAATHDEGQRLAVEAMRQVVGAIAYRLSQDSPQFYPGLPVRVEPLGGGEE